MNPMPDSALADPQQIIAQLQRQLAECRAERDEALQRETATAEALQVINRSPGDLAPVFDALLDRWPPAGTSASSRPVLPRNTSPRSTNGWPRRRRACNAGLKVTIGRWSTEGVVCRCHSLSTPRGFWRAASATWPTVSPLSIPPGLTRPG